MQIDLNLSFRTPEQKEFFECSTPNAVFSGGFGNGKTVSGCQIGVQLMTTFPNYRLAIARFEESKLKQTTMKTFFKEFVCPPALYDTNYGGNRADSLNKCRFINGSEVLWMNLKEQDDGMIRGLEVDTVLVDQLEEIDESQYILLDARVGRWDQAEVPEKLLRQYPDWPIANNTRKPKIPAYFRGLCNPDSELHFIWKRYHPDSPDWKEKYHANHTMVQARTTNATVSDDLLAKLESNDPEWVDRYVLGKWGIPGGQIHTVHPSSILDPDNSDVATFLDQALKRGNLFRVMDHGDAAPTCCLWFCSYGSYHIIYREYYRPNALISDHRKAIKELSGDEKYVLNLADPDIFKLKSQKYGSRWSVAQDYLDRNLGESTRIAWQPADNNEFSCRDRVSELLRLDADVIHPITKLSGAPRLYFVTRTAAYPNGCSNAQAQTKAQKREKIGTIDGKDYYSDERAKGVPDHAYDPIRYYAISHTKAPIARRRAPGRGSFFAARKEAIRMKRFINAYK